MPSGKYIKAIEKALIKEAPPLSKEELRWISSYVGTKHKVLGLTTPVQKELSRQNYRIDWKKTDQLSVFDEAFKTSGVMEVKNAALFFIDHHYKKLDKERLFKFLPSWVNYVDNWAHSDYLSKFYSRFVEDETYRGKFLAKLKEWNRSSNPWKRRQSLVSLAYYARTRKNHLPFKTSAGLVKALLKDKDYFVQKGVGWALREMYNVHPKLTYAFVATNYNNISSTAFAAASEKMSVTEKNALKQKRKLHRIKKIYRR